LPENFQKADLERALEAGLKRFSSGFLKTVALHAPASTPPMPQLGMAGGGKRFSLLRDTLAEEHNLTRTDLKSGQVPDEADLLLLASPDRLDDKQLFAVDQFLMRGGTVVVATSPFDIDTRGALSARTHDSGLQDWLSHQGIQLAEKMVLDPQNAAFPIPVNRRLGGFVVRETQLVDYPYFVDVRGDGLGAQSGLTAGIDQVTLTWPSPIALDDEKNQGREVIGLLQSTDQAWTSDNLDIQPDFRAHGPLGFAPRDQRRRELLAVAVQGRFESWFKDKPSPLAAEEEAEETGEETALSASAADGEEPGEAEAGEENETEEKNDPVITRVIDRYPESARIILFASNSFLTVTMLDLAASGMGTRYLNPVQLVENAIDWSLEDSGLLSLRGRAHFSRTLDPVDQKSQMFWEYLNYGLALFGLLMVWLIRRQSNRRAQLRYAAVLNTSE
jgi:ABC-2 type transport system permease protein